jgi:hypothetical protein
MSDTRVRQTHTFKVIDNREYIEGETRAKLNPMLVPKMLLTDEQREYRFGLNVLVRKLRLNAARNDVRLVWADATAIVAFITRGEPIIDSDTGLCDVLPLHVANRLEERLKCYSLRDLSRQTAADVAALMSIGPKVLDAARHALARAGLTFADERPS